MSIEIKETLTRRCCEERDMVSYFGKSPDYETIARLKPVFCKHCGQLWVAETYTDAAGGQDWKRVPWSW